MISPDTPSISIAQLDARSATAAHLPTRPRSSTIPSSFERLLADLSARFINLPAAEIDGAITDALRSIVELLGVDRSQLVRFRPRLGQADVTHSWAVQGVRAIAPMALTQAYPWAIRRVQADHASGVRPT